MRRGVEERDWLTVNQTKLFHKYRKLQDYSQGISTKENTQAEAQ